MLARGRARVGAAAGTHATAGLDIGTGSGYCSAPEELSGQPEELCPINLVS